MSQHCGAGGGGGVGTPTGAYGRLFTPAATRSLFPASSVCSCRPGESSPAAGCSPHRSPEEMHLESTTSEPIRE